MLRRDKSRGYALRLRRIIAHWFDICAANSPTDLSFNVRLISLTNSAGESKQQAKGVFVQMWICRLPNERAGMRGAAAWLVRNMFISSFPQCSSIYPQLSTKLSTNLFTGNGHTIVLRRDLPGDILTDSVVGVAGVVGLRGSPGERYFVGAVC